MAELRYERAVDLLEAELGDELVALSVEDGNYFGFNSVAASVWRALETPRSFTELKDRLLGEFEVSPDQCANELKTGKHCRWHRAGDARRRGIVRLSLRPWRVERLVSTEMGH